jgi:uncharacterized protein
MQGGGFLVPEVLDECERVAYLSNSMIFRNDRLELRLLPTEQCNLRCSYCYETFAKGAMSPEIVRRLSLLLSKRGPTLRHLGLHWFGGEPLLACDVIRELSAVALSLKERHGLVYEASITTNGVLLTPGVIADLLAHGITFFQVTIDGLGAENDRRRRFPDGSGTFAILLDNVKASRHLTGNFHLAIRMNFDRDNIDSCRDLVSLVSTVTDGDPRYSVFFRAIGDYGNTSSKMSDLHLAVGAERLDTSLQLGEHAHACGMQVSGGFVPPRLNLLMCYAALPYSFVIGSDGTVYKCTVHFTSDMNVVGQIDQEGDITLDVHKMSRWVGSKVLGDRRCQACALLASCQRAACPAANVGCGERRCALPVRSVKKELCALLKNNERMPESTFQKESTS